MTTATPEPTDPAGVSEMADELRALAARYSDTMGLTREGAIRRIGVLHDAILDAADRLASLRTPPVLEVAKEALEQAARWFEEYAVDHEVKARRAVAGPEHQSRTDKAKRNQERADYLRAALSKHRGAWE